MSALFSWSCSYTLRIQVAILNAPSLDKACHIYAQVMHACQARSCPSELSCNEIVSKNLCGEYESASSRTYTHRLPILSQATPHHVQNNTNTHVHTHTHTHTQTQGNAHVHTHTIIHIFIIHKLFVS